jgi:hypothetical protein
MELTKKNVEPTIQTYEELKQFFDDCKLLTDKFPNYYELGKSVKQLLTIKDSTN